MDEYRNDDYGVMLSDAKNLSSEVVRFFTEFTLSEVEWVQNDARGRLYSSIVNSCWPPRIRIWYG